MRANGVPRESPAESGMASRVRLLRWPLLLLFLLLLTRLWYLQVIRGPEYRQLAEKNRIRVVRLKPLRGLILDRHGAVLADNKPDFRLVLIREQVSDPRQGLALTVEDLAVTLPLEMHIEVDENETVRLTTASPWRTETSFEPVLHSLSIRVVLENGA